MPRSSIDTARIAPVIGPFSAAIAVNGLVLVSGQVALEPVTAKLIVGDVTMQTRQVLANLSAVLEAGGKSLADVVKANVYLANMDDFQAMNKEYERHFDRPFPARTTVEVARLPLDALVEIEVLAA